MIAQKKNVKIQNEGYMIQLDSLRAIAVLNVMFSHFTPANVPKSFASSLFPVYDWFPGVPLFFVLSGFLITGILLRCRDTMESNQQSFGFTLKRFYIRRFLRILPIYYLTLFVTAIIFKQVRNIFFWHLTYTTNIMVLMKGSFDETSTHFWSLSMEEQFYLFWPFIILLIPKKYLLKVILATIALAFISRVGCYSIGLNHVQIYVFPLTSLDSLGLGALLAFLIHYQYDRTKQSLCNLGLWICFPILILSIIFQKIEVFEILFKPTILALFYVWLVNHAAVGFCGFVGKILELEPLVFIGKISYGLYIYHYFMIPIFFKVFRSPDSANKVSVSFEIVLEFSATLIVAMLSWFLIEKPINNIKHKFSYRKA
jgi:peptidoglycan/LPS O-acetylase OafA/YrhL